MAERNLRAIRKRKRLTQQELSEKTGLYPYHISGLERGRYRANQETRQKIEAVLGKIDWIDKVKVRKGDFRKAENLVRQLVEITLLLSPHEREAISKMISKFFEVRNPASPDTRSHTKQHNYSKIEENRIRNT